MIFSFIMLNYWHFFKICSYKILHIIFRDMHTIQLFRRNLFRSEPRLFIYTKHSVYGIEIYWHNLVYFFFYLKKLIYSNLIALFRGFWLPHLYAFFSLNSKLRQTKDRSVFSSLDFHCYFFYELKYCRNSNIILNQLLLPLKIWQK